jgi:lipopolysaccharide export system protein LptA
MMMIFLRLWWGMGLISLSALSWSLPTDRQQVLHASSDMAALDRVTGISTYTGNVYVQQGTTQLIADQVIIKQNAQHQVIEAVAYGKPATYKTIPQVGKDEVTATAAEIHYYPPQHYLELIKDAVVIQGNNRYAAPLIHYDTEQQTVVSPANQDGRVHITLVPSTLNKKAQS